MLARACLVVFGVSMVLSLDVPKIKLNNGKEMPALALGTYLGLDQANILKSRDKPVRNAICRAIELGYRHIDTAAIYETEAEVGAALKIKFEGGTLKREDIFITTKLWNTQHKREQVPLALRDSLQKLGINYVDLYLMHWPIGLYDDYSYSSVEIIETWRGFEDVLKLGLAKSIGVSNFNKEQMEKLLRDANVKPAVLQIEVHPQMVQSDLVSYCQSNNITVMGYSPLGTMVPRFGVTLPGPKLDDPVLTAIAEKYGKTTAQIVLRWQVERKIVPVIKSLNPKRLEQNLDIFDFKLTEDEMAKVAPGTTYRLIAPSFWQDHKDYPFEKVPVAGPNPFVK